MLESQADSRVGCQEGVTAGARLGRREASPDTGTGDASDSQPTRCGHSPGDPGLSPDAPVTGLVHPVPSKPSGTSLCSGRSDTCQVGLQNSCGRRGVDGSWPVPRTPEVSLLVHPPVSLSCVPTDLAFGPERPVMPYSGAQAQTEVTGHGHHYRPSAGSNGGPRPKAGTPGRLPVLHPPLSSPNPKSRRRTADDHGASSDQQDRFFPFPTPTAVPSAAALPASPRSTWSRVKGSVWSHVE